MTPAGDSNSSSRSITARQLESVIVGKSAPPPDSTCSRSIERNRGANIAASDRHVSSPGSDRQEGAFAVQMLFAVACGCSLDRSPLVR